MRLGRSNHIPIMRRVHLALTCVFPYLDIDPILITRCKRGLHENSGTGLGQIQRCYHGVCMYYWSRIENLDLEYEIDSVVEGGDTERLINRRMERMMGWQQAEMSDVSPLEPVPGSPLCLGVGSSAAGPRLSPGSLQRRSVSAGHSPIAPTWTERAQMRGRGGQEERWKKEQEEAKRIINNKNIYGRKKRKTQQSEGTHFNLLCFPEDCFVLF